MRGNHERLVSIDEVHRARERIGPYVRRTPIMTSETLDRLLHAKLFFKCENFQRTGAFKARGALNAVWSLEPNRAVGGVVTSSSGNQAAALSWAASLRGIPAYVAMPKCAIKSKVSAVRRYGGQIIWVESRDEVPTTEEYERAVTRIQSNTGAELVHAYDDERTIAGQGSCALEILEAVANLDAILVPVGGGGLVSGVALVAKAKRPELRVVGCEPEMADDAYQSFHTRKAIACANPRTIADGLRASVSGLTFAHLLNHVDEIVTVSEGAIIQAMRLAWEVLKIVIEPSSAVPIAALLEKKVLGEDKRIAVVLSGGNADLTCLPWNEPCENMGVPR